eukprot:TRINITY_DN1289_c0_g1_i2.p1 TRINITY_DN1289_c0_g1~~TRINITY_DN1289_c0_g1_i2.p1  ORF type:complete len:226 (-),score=102.83 TRINITY_DN1289_c0_g1_i2:1284-1961(-)
MNESVCAKDSACTRAQPNNVDQQQRLLRQQEQEAEQQQQRQQQEGKRHEQPQQRQQQLQLQLQQEELEQLQQEEQEQLRQEEEEQLQQEQQRQYQQQQQQHESQEHPVRPMPEDGSLMRPGEVEAAACSAAPGAAARGSALQRYMEKKKSRSFGKRIRYENRKARADVCKRVRGRFVKSGATSDSDFSGTPTAADVADSNPLGTPTATDGAGEQSGAEAETPAGE